MFELLKYLALLVVSIICMKYSYAYLAGHAEIVQALMYFAIPLTLIIHLKKKWLLNNIRTRHLIFFVTNVIYLLLIGHFSSTRNLAMLAIYVLLLALSIFRIYLFSKQTDPAF